MRLLTEDGDFGGEFRYKKNANHLTFKRLAFLDVVPPRIEHIIYPARKCLVHSVLIYLKIIETTESDYMQPSSYFNNLLSSSH